MSDFGTPPPPPPPPQFPAFPTEPPPSAPVRNGPAWEQPGQTVQRFIDTAKAVLMDPSTMFATMRREGGLQNPLFYYLLGAVVGLAGSLVWNMFGLGMPWRGADYGEHVFSVSFTLVVLPICYVIGVFISSAIYHLMLMLLGAQKFPYETTFRVVAYAAGSTMPLAILPLCGGLIGAIWSLICVVIGLAQAQETTIGKAAGAVLIPVVICCGLGILFWGMIFALIAGGAAAGMSR